MKGREQDLVQKELTLATKCSQVGEGGVNWHL